MLLAVHFGLAWEGARAREGQIDLSGFARHRRRNFDWVFCSILQTSSDKNSSEKSSKNVRLLQDCYLNVLDTDSFNFEKVNI